MKGIWGIEKKCDHGSSLTAIKTSKIMENSCQVGDSSISSVQFLSHVGLFAIPWTVACQASLSITNSYSSLKFMSI